MYYQKFIDFLKKHNIYDENIVRLWQENSIHFNYMEEEKRDLIGCYYIFKNNILTKINLIVPFIEDEKTVLINVHEYIHFYLLYHKIGKKCNLELDKETLPILFEKIYVEENDSKELNTYYQYLIKRIKENPQKEYIIALELLDPLLKEYKKNNNIFKTEKKAKKLVKRKQ